MSYNSGGSTVEPLGPFFKTDTMKMLMQTVELDVDECLKEVLEIRAILSKN